MSGGVKIKKNVFPASLVKGHHGSSLYHLVCDQGMHLHTIVYRVVCLPVCWLSLEKLDIRVLDSCGTHLTCVFYITGFPRHHKHFKEAHNTASKQDEMVAEDVGLICNLCMQFYLQVN